MYSLQNTNGYIFGWVFHLDKLYIIVSWARYPRPLGSSEPLGLGYGVYPLLHVNMGIGRVVLWGGGGAVLSRLLPWRGSNGDGGGLAVMGACLNGGITHRTGGGLTCHG